MNHLKALVLMQLKDKLDFSFTQTKKTLIRKIVFTVLKFALVLASAYLISFLLDLFVFDASDFPRVMIFVLTFFMAASLLTSTIGLVKSLYFADDNKVLITLPIENSWLFISKLIVYYLYQLIKECMLTLPAILGIGVYILSKLSVLFIPWTMLTMLLIPAVPVLLGALLSIPSLYIARFANKYQIAKILLFVIGVGAFVAAIAWAISLLPENIDLINQGPALIMGLKNFLLQFSEAFPPTTKLVDMFIGIRGSDMTYNLFQIQTLLIFLELIGVIALCFGLVYLVSKPLFFSMMSKSFEFEKKQYAEGRENKAHGKWYTLLNKEFKLCVMNTDVSMGFIGACIAVPLLIYLMNSLYAAMNTSLKGNTMAWAFNILIMLLPMLSANGIIATLFSKEGRAGYMKKTKPVNILYPLLAKLFFFLVLSIPSVIATVSVFGSFYNEHFTVFDCILLALTLLAFQYGHIFFSAMLDIMNPQNEQYATIGESVQNPNENKSTALAFAISIIIALFAYLILSDYSVSFRMGNITMSMLRLLFIGGAFCASTVILFIKNVKAYYYEK